LWCENSRRDEGWSLARIAGKDVAVRSDKIQARSGTAEFFMPHAHHDMQTIGTALEKVVANSLRRAPAGDGPLLAWPFACGSAVAERTRALEFADGILRIGVADAGWRRELQALAPRYVAQINRYTSEGVTRIEFVVLGSK
jgi:hypothetical protein